MRVILFIFVLFTGLLSSGQIHFESYHATSKKICPQSNYSYTEYNPLIIHRPLNPQFESAEKEPLTIENKELKGNSEFKSVEEIELPLIQFGFEDVYDNNWIPNDNSMAISNDGYMITMRNAKISFYDPSLQLLETKTLGTFTAPLGITGSKYDPRVIYDQAENRFVAVILSGFDYSSSNVVIAFSSTSDPRDPWNFYTVSGNFLNDSTWSDFPSIALSEEELFISVTNFDDSLSSNYWEFYGCRIIQMNKMQGYDGDSLVDFTYHVVNPGFGVDTPSVVYYYNVIPVKGGDSLYGPEMYFVSTLDCPFPDSLGNYAPNDSVFLVKFSGNQYDPSFNITSEFLESTINYGISSSTPQPNAQSLQTNYNTIKDVVFENNKIHFLLNSIDYANNQAGIFHGIISDPEGTISLSSTMISFDTLGVAFPSIAYVGEFPGDEKYIIGFNYASSTLYPGNACLVYDNGNYSPLRVLKEGQSIMNLTSSNAERWGDYTTMQKKYNEPQFVFFAGSYGRSNDTHTWITKMTLDTAYLSIDDPKKNDEILYPVPASERLQVRFTLDQMQTCTFSIYSINGQLMDEILSYRVKEGENEFSFDVSGLSAGLYILAVNGSKGYAFSRNFTIHN